MCPKCDSVYVFSYLRGPAGGLSHSYLTVLCAVGVQDVYSISSNPFKEFPAAP